MPNLNHGDKTTIELEIINVATSLNRYDKYAIAVIPNTEYTHNVINLTPEHLENLSEKCGAPEFMACANAVNTGDDSSYLQIEMTWKAKGQPIGLHKDGSPITNKNGSEVHETSYYDTGNIILILGDDANAKITTLNERIDFEMGMKLRIEKRANVVKARRRRLAGKEVTSTTETQIETKTKDPVF